MSHRWEFGDDTGGSLVMSHRWGGLLMSVDDIGAGLVMSHKWGSGDIIQLHLHE